MTPVSHPGRFSAWRQDSMGLIELVFQVLYRGYRITEVLSGHLVMFWDVVITAVSYVAGAVIRVAFIVVMEGVTLWGTWWLVVRAHYLFVGFFAFVAGETAVVVIVFSLPLALFTFSFTFRSQEQEEGYSPLENDGPVDVEVPDPLSF